MSNSRIASHVAQTTIGGYPLLEKLGEGGMGAVYKATNPMNGKFVAVKVVRQAIAADEVLRMRFAQECQVARKLNHPHIVEVLDFGLDGSRPYLVMEYVDGESLGDWLARDGQLPEEEAVRVISQVGQALHWAHQRRIVHRDVKPDNILLDIMRTAKLTDMGLVKNLEGDYNLTRTSSSLGTPNFMAPEQFEDAKRADARSDLYALGATLYMTVTGHLPFSGRSAKAVATVYKKKLTCDIAPPRQIVPALSSRLEDQIMRSLDPDREKRHESVEVFIRSLVGPVETPSAIQKKLCGGRKERGKTRFTSRRGTACKPLQRAPDKAWSGRVLNISEGGMCLELERRYEPGALLTVVLDGSAAKRGSMVARVVWVRQDVPKKWTLGCQFDQPLCDFEVEELR